VKVYRSLRDIRLSNCAVAIGVFDGVHRGHQLVLRRARDEARRIEDGTSIALTFDRHPAEVIAPRNAPLYLSSLSQRLEMIERYCPVDAVLVVPFNLKFANLPASAFVEEILVDILDSKRIFVGADFRYGKDRAGGVMDLEAAGESFQFTVEVVHSVADIGERVSSTRIRALVANGNIEGAQRLLGHPYTLRGKVVAGKQLGRTIGYPTANLEPEQLHQLLPATGVYAARVELPGNDEERTVWPAAVSVGFNPTTDTARTEPKVEAYIMDDFSKDIYDLTIDIQFVKKIRGEERFESLDALVAQIDRDVQTTAEILSGSLTQDK
jgi:riboflavin kinase / FMN adenylyltransferase